MSAPQPTDKLLVVLAATGLQGSSVVDWLLQHEPGTYRIRGTTRNTSSPAAQALKDKGVEVVGADANDPSSLEAAFSGASVIFAYTDFAGCLQSPQMTELLQRGEAKGPAEAGAKVEVQQGKNIADAASKVQGLERFVWSNLTDVKERSGGKYTNVVHFNSKADIWRYINTLPSLKDKASAVVMGTFADNVIRLPLVFNITKESEGHYVYRVNQDGDSIVPYIDVKRDTGAFVNALINAPAGLQVIAESEPLTPKEWLDLWAKELGVKARFEKLSKESFAENSSMGPLTEPLLEILSFVEEFGFTGGDPEILSPGEFEKKTGVLIPRTKIVDHIRGEDWSAVL